MKIGLPHILIWGAILTTPFLVSAGVVINEVAWMGSANGGTGGTNANDEWIELYNTSTESVDISEWSLVGTGGTPSISFVPSEENTSFIIPPQSFYILERSDDNSAQGVSANFIYAGSLSNSGEKLVLADSSGIVVDTVDGSNEWSIGGSIAGNNATKDSASLVGAAWVTASPTPGAPNSSESVQVPQPVAPDTTSISIPVATAPPSSTALTEPPLSAFSSAIKKEYILVSGGDNTRVVMAGARVLFKGASSRMDGAYLFNTQYYWSFGDGGRGRTQNVSYLYERPGDYVVILRVESGNFSATDRIDVKVIKADMTISNVEWEGSSSFVEIKNGSSYEMNVSGWKIRSGTQTFTIPEHTVILPRSIVAFPSLRIGISLAGNTSVELLYPDGLTASQYEKPAPPPQNTPSLMTPQVTLRVSSQERPISTPRNTSRTLDVASLSVSSSTISTSTQSAVVLYSGASKESSVLWWVFAVVLIVCLAIWGMIYARKEHSGTDGYLIIEEE